MNIKRKTRENPVEVGFSASTEIWTIHIEISDVESRTQEIVSSITDTSWLNKLDPIPRTAFSIMAQRTIAKLISEVLIYKNNTLDESLGEYLVSTSAQDSLCNNFTHCKIPLAELIKEKVSGNPGFDFHTESHNQNIVFGEAKYNSNQNPYRNAIEQAHAFFTDEKDKIDVHLFNHFFTAGCVERHSNQKKKGCAAAFSLNAKNPDTVFENILCHECFKAMVFCDEIYLIGVEIA